MWWAARRLWLATLPAFGSNAHRFAGQVSAYKGPRAISGRPASQTSVRIPPGRAVIPTRASSPDSAPRRKPARRSGGPDRDVGQLVAEVLDADEYRSSVAPIALTRDCPA